MSSGIIFLDIATTGPDPTRHQPWEVAYIRRRPGRPDDEWTWQYRPVSLTGADPAMLRTAKYYERMSCPIAGMAEAVSAAAANAAEARNAVTRTVDEKRRDDWVDTRRRLAATELATLIAGHLDRNVVVTRNPITPAFIAAFLSAHSEIATWAPDPESIGSRIGGYLAAAGGPIPAGASAATAIAALGLDVDLDRQLPPATWAGLIRDAWDRTMTPLDRTAEPSGNGASEPSPVGPADDEAADDEDADGPAF
jgi:hypothetical protein